MDDLIWVVEHVVQFGLSGTSVVESLAELLVEELNLLHLLHFYFLFLGDMELLLLFELLLVLKDRLRVLCELHTADALLQAELCWAQADYQVHQGVTVVEATFEEVGEFRVSVGDVES